MIRVVWLHGFAGSPRTFDAVRAHLDVPTDDVAPALTGHAGCDADVDTFEDEVDRLATVVPPGPPPVLVGYSLGGRLAMGLLVRHPGRWRGAVLIGAQSGIADPDERAARRAADARWAAMLRTDGVDAFVTAWEAQPLFASQRALPAHVQAAQRRERARHEAGRLAHAIQVLSPGAMPCWDEGLAGVRVPIVYLAGGADEKFTAVGRRLAVRVPSVALTVVPGAGHNVALEAPAATAAAIADLLRHVEVSHA